MSPAARTTSSRAPRFSSAQQRSSRTGRCKLHASPTAETERGPRSKLGRGLEKAKQVMAAAEAEAKRRNWKMNIAVVDTNGELVHFSRMEGAQIASVSISVGKAR